MPTPTSRRAPGSWWVWAAAALTVLSLGLPWSARGSEYVAGWTTPGFCSPGADGVTVDCTPMYTSPGYTIATGGGSGSGSLARVGIVIVLVLGVLAWRTGRRSLAVAALVAAGATVALAGLSASPGVIALLVGALGFYLATTGRRPGASDDALPADGATAH